MATTNRSAGGHDAIPGYTYGTPSTAHSPLTLDDLAALKAAVGLTTEDEHAAWTKSVMLHVTVWSRPYVPADNW